MASISFKSVGTTRIQRVQNTLSSSLVPMGIQTPLELSTDGTLFKVNYSLADQVNDNLKNLILTNWGDRVGLYDFGANLRPILSELSSQDDFDARAMINIKGAIDKWMPFISLKEFESFKINSTDNANANGLAVIKIAIVYSVPLLKVKDRKLEITLYAM